MMKNKPHRGSLAKAAYVGLFWAFSVVGAFGAGENFVRDAKALASSPHRLVGTAEGLRAAGYVENRLREIGVDRLLVQDFPTVQSKINRCEMLLQTNTGEKKLPLYPMRANGIMNPVSPKEGIIGKIFIAGQGRPEDYGDRPVKDRIVVLDYNAGSQMRLAFRFGAKAVVFVSNGFFDARQFHYLETDVNLPRFFYSGSPADLAEGSEATIHSEIVWEAVMGRNVMGFVRGTAPTFHLEKEEMAILATSLDSYGEIPVLSRGGRGAANCASLLHLAEYFRNNRPKRHTLFVFFDGEARGHAGSSAFYRALETETKEIRLESRKSNIENEKRYLADIEALVQKENPLGITADGRLASLSGSPAKRNLLELLKKKAAARKFSVDEEIQDIRLSIRKGATETPETRDRLVALAAAKLEWNALRRSLVKLSFTRETMDKLAVIVPLVRVDINARTKELASERHVFQCDSAVAALVSPYWISLHTSLVLGDATPYWGLLIGGDSMFRGRMDNVGLYGRVQTTFLSACEGLPNGGPAHFMKSTVDGTLDRNDMLLASSYFTHSGEIAGSGGIYNLAFGTNQEPLNREGTPQDVLEALSLDRIEQQAAEIATVMGAVLAQERLSLLRAIGVDKFFYGPVFESNTPEGPRAMSTSTGSTFPDKPVAAATLRLYITDAHRNWLPRRAVGQSYQPSKIPAFDDFEIIRTNQNGSYTFGPAANWANYLGFCAVFDERGEIILATGEDSKKTVKTRQDMYPVRHGYAVLLPQIDPSSAEVKPLFDARTNSNLTTVRSSYSMQDGVISWFTEKKVEGLKLFDISDPSMVCLANGPLDFSAGEKEQDPYGSGLRYSGPWNSPQIGRQGGGDLWRLNDSRISLLRAKGCLNSSLEELHSRAQDLLLQARTTVSEPLAEALAFSSQLIERTVYQKSRGTMDDLVRAVLVLLALSVPFAFALERLIIGSTIIYRQVGWFVGFFILTFAILFATHPAFSISATPMVIFLGFAVIIMSVLVITIILRKFEYELKTMQGMSLGVHAADVSRFSTILAAMNMGISTMRRRPLRTALTATTTVLLTFTILSFASFGALTGIVKIYLSPPPPYTGVFFHKLEWTELNRDLRDLIQLRHGEKAVICPRLWVAPLNEESKNILVTAADGTRPVVLRGLLGLSNDELQYRPDIMGLLGAPQSIDGAVWLSRSVAGRLGVAEGDSVLMAGKKLRVGRLIDPTQVLRTKDMDRSELLPVNFAQMGAGQTTAKSSGGDVAFNKNVRAVQEKKNWSNLSIDMVGIVSAQTAAEMGANLHAVSMYTKDAQAATEIAEDLARMFSPAPVYATRNDGVSVHVLGPVLQASGLKDLIFPILLGGLVIFGTMLGSVTDREKEIYSFSALGLAPPHVAGLFFAESLVYSLVGGMGGYLLSNGVVKILGILSVYGLVRVPEMNYSSSNAVITILIVMGTVLVSTIYPAMKASRSANPGIMRSWRLPTPDGDMYDLVFPFTVSGYDITGVVSFLREHFDNFSDAGIGTFMAQDTRIMKTEKGVGLRARLALAPFDLGVTQSFELHSTPSEIAGIDEVKIRIERVSGQPKDWQRLNRVLLNDLRKQFLIWRSISPEAMETYRSRTLTELEAQTAAVKV